MAAPARVYQKTEEVKSWLTKNHKYLADFHAENAVACAVISLLDKHAKNALFAERLQCMRSVLNIAKRFLDNFPENKRPLLEAKEEEMGKK